jgi:hypothetical protein
VIVAVIAIGMVQAPVNQVIEVVPVRNCLMATARAMPMRLIVSRGPMLWVTPIRVRGANFNDVFIGASIFHVLQMALVEIINVTFMLNGNMSAPRTMHMRSIGGGHRALPFLITACLRLLCRMIDSDSDLIEDLGDRSSRHLDAPWT